MKSKSSKKETQSLGMLGGLFGRPVTAVLRRLGKEGVSTAHVRDIMKAKGVKVSDTTVSIQVNAGRNKDADRGKPADLTAGFDTARVFSCSSLSRSAECYLEH